MARWKFSQCPETYISIDVETAGPNPSQYSLLSIGACLATQPEVTFYAELQPVNGNATAQALSISGLSLSELARSGLPPAQAMAQFEAWVLEQTPPGHRPVFVAFNAPFDWMFVNDYFHRFLGHNPFGHSALDLKAFFMALNGVCWSQTSLEHVALHYLRNQSLTHHALQDALDQAELFREMLAEALSRCPQEP